MAVGRLVEAQQLFAQAFPGDAEQFCRPALVALAGVEGPLYQQALRLFQIECRLEVRQRFPGGGGACLYTAVARQGCQQFGRKIRRPDDAARSISLLSSRTLPGQS